MIPRTRHAAVLAIPLLLLVSRSVAQEKTGTAQDVEKRLKAAQKPHGVARLKMSSQRCSPLTISSKPPFPQTAIPSPG